MEARKIGKIKVIAKSGRHKAQKTVLINNAICVIDRELEFIKWYYFNDFTNTSFVHVKISFGKISYIILHIEVKNMKKLAQELIVSKIRILKNILYDIFFLILIYTSWLRYIFLIKYVFSWKKLIRGKNLTVPL